MFIFDRRIQGPLKLKNDKQHTVAPMNLTSVIIGSPCKWGMNSDIVC